jgi:dienelactone hydrolase
MRLGDTAAIDAYLRHDRIRDGDRDAVLESAYQGWLTDERAGKNTLLIAGDSATVTELNRRARADLVAAGQVEPSGVSLAGSGTAGVGDRVVTRQNNRLCSTGQGFVKNGDKWVVTRVAADGSLSVRRPSGGPAITLASAYVREHVELGYATTAHRSQGRTVDTAHVVVTGPSMTREVLYVGMTRAREANTAYVCTGEPAADCDELAVGEVPSTAREIMVSVLSHVGADVAAHEVMRQEQDAAAGVATLADEYETLAALADKPRHLAQLRTAGLTEAQVAFVATSDSFGALSAVLRFAEACRVPVAALVSRLLGQRGMAGAEDLAAVLHGRLSTWITGAALRPDPGQMIAGLIPTAVGSESELQAGLDQRAQLIERRADALVEQALNASAEWLCALGPVPDDPATRIEWLRNVRTVAAYRDRYPAIGDSIEPVDIGSRNERLRALQAVQSARSLSRPNVPHRSPSIPFIDHITPNHR